MTLQHRSPITIAAFGFAISAVIVLGAVMVGTADVSVTDVIDTILGRTIPDRSPTSAVADAIVWNIRLPRVIAALAAGAALGAGGVALQGTFRNSVADPQLVGLSSVGGVGVLTGLWLGWGVGGPVAGIVGGAVAGLAGSIVVRRLSRGSSGDPSRFILVGIGFGLFVSAIVASASVAIHDPRIPDVSFWFVGGLAATTWASAWWMVGFAVIAVGLLLPYAGDLDVMTLGTAAARHLGVRVGFVTAVVVASVGLAVGASVGAAGVVAFVGLIGGHLARAVVGHHHVRTIVAGAFLGGWFLVLCDAIGRVVGGRFEVPVGLITAIIGGPFLVVLILREGASE